MGKYKIAALGKSFNYEMLEILHSVPITTDSISLCFDRQPDIFRMAEIKYDPFFYLGFFHEQKLEGFVLNGYYRALINGTAESVFHFTDYYINHDSRGKGFGYQISEHFFRETYNNARLGFSIIMDGNNEALGLIGRRHPKYPYVPWSKIINKLEVKTIILAWPVKTDPSFDIRHASLEDIPRIVELLNLEHKNRLFGMTFSETTFQKLLAGRPGFSIDSYYLAIDKSKNICGVCAAWDCTSFKQTRVIRYGARFFPTRVGHWFLAGLYGLPTLPDAGEAFRDITLIDYAVMDRNVNIMKALLKVIYNDYRKKGYHTIIWGSSADDPLLQSCGEFFHQSVISNIVLMSTKPELIEDGAVQNYLPFIDISCL